LRQARSTITGQRPIALLAVVALLIVGCGQTQPSGSTLAGTPSLDPPSAGSPSQGTTSPRPPPSVIPRTLEASISAIRLPNALSRAVAVTLGSDVLICGGLTPGGTTTSSIVQLNVASGQISRAGSLAVAVHDAGGAAFNGRAYVIGGGRLVAGSTVQGVDSGGTATLVGALPAARADLAAVTIGGEIVVVGGGTPGHPDGRVLATTDGRQFRVVARLLVPVRYPAVAVLGGLVYVAGGSTASSATSAIQVVDVSTGRVRIIGHLPRPISDASGLVIGNRILIAGGRSAGRTQGELWQLDVTSGAVRDAGRLPYPVADAAAVVVDQIGYLFGGETVGPVASTIVVSVQ
jgi:hypothetical protein